MPANTSPIFPLTPAIGIADLSGATALTTRTTIVGVTGLTAVTAASTNGKRIDSITVKGVNTVAGAAGIVMIWLYNGTNSTLLDEIDISAITPSTTVSSVLATKTYTALVLPPTYRLYASVTVAAGGNTNCVVYAFGDDY